MQSRALVFGSALIVVALSACAHPSDTQSVAFESRAPIVAVDPAHTAPVGGHIVVRLDRPVGTDVSYAGDFFSGRLAAPLMAVDGGVLVPEGAVVHGSIAGITLRPPSITLRFDSLNVGTADVPLDAAILSVRDGDIALKDAINAADEARYSTLMRRIDVGEIEPPVDSPPTDVSREQLRISAGTLVELMLTSPIVVGRR